MRAEVRAFRRGALWVALATTAVFQAGVMGAFTYLAPVVTLVAGFGAVTMAAAFGMGVAVFVAATPLAARALALAGRAPTLASAVNVSAFNVGNTLGPWLGGLVIAAGWGFRAPAALGAGLLAVAIALGLVSRALDGRR